MKTEFYFAYGSNLNEADWEARTGLKFRRAFQKCGLAYLPDACLGFTRHSAGAGGGVLDIVVSLPVRFTASKTKTH